MHLNNNREVVVWPFECGAIMIPNVVAIITAVAILNQRKDALDYFLI